MHGRLSILVDEAVFCRDVQQQRVRDCVLFAQQAIDSDAVIADRGIDIGALMPSTSFIIVARSTRRQL